MKYAFPHDLWLVEFDEGQMKYAIKNLIINTSEAMPQGGLLNVRAENFENLSESSGKSLSLLEGRYVKISIRDEGIGIPKEHILTIFDPYFSTKERGAQKGMGFGLATTYSIINRHDGRITVESEIGIGTTFTIYLPAMKKPLNG